MKKNAIKEQYGLTERLFYKLMNENRIFRTSYRDYEVDKAYFANFSVDNYWKSYNQRPEIIAKRKLANEQRSNSMKKFNEEKHGKDTNS